MIRRRVAVVALTGLALVLTACPSPTPTSTPTPSGDGPPTPVTSEQPVQGGTLRVALRDLGSLDPAKASGRGALTVAAQIFDPLTRIDPTTNSVVPAAARKWTVTKNGTVWRFRIAARRYQDGTPVRARDFEFAFDRIARQKTRSDAAFQLEQVRGFRSAKFGDAKTLAGVEARGPDLLVITLSRPYYEFPYQLAHPALGPLSVKRYGKSLKGIDRTPLGNGPFAVARSTQKSAELERFDGYQGEQPYLDGISFSVADSVESAWEEFQRDEVQVADVPPSALTGTSAAYEEVGFTPFWATLSFALNLNRSKYAKPAVRRALSMAIDRDAIAETVYGGTRDPATGIIPRGVRGFMPEACAACAFRPDRAKQILDDAFGKRKPTITIDFLAERSSRQVARAIANDLDDVGIQAKLSAHSLNGYRKLLDRNGQDFAQIGWLSDVPSPDPFLAQQLGRGSPNNHSEYKDATFDRLVKRARATINDAKRLKRYRAAEQRALQKMPLIPIVFFRNRTAVAPNVRGLVLDGAGLFDGARVWLAG